MLAADPHALRADLPGAADVRVEHRLLAAAIGRALGDGDELLRLDRQKRQRDGSDALDLQPRCENLNPAGGEEIARPVNRAEQG
jgi:hypothetical protein